MPDTQPTTSTATHEQSAPPQSTMAAYIATLEQKLQHALSTCGTLQQIGTLQAELAQEMRKRAALQQSARVTEEKWQVMERRYEWEKAKADVMGEMLDRKDLL